MEIDKELMSFLDLKSRVLDIDKIVETRALSISEIAEWRGGKKKLIAMENIRRLDLKQKSKIRWLVDGDENSKFFHGTLKSKSRKNQIHGLQINGNW